MLNTVDYVIIGLAGICFIVGIIRGLLKQAFAIGGVVIVATCSSYLTPFAQPYVEKVITDPQIASIVCFVLAALVLLIVWSIISSLICRVVEHGAMGVINRILGGVIGIAIVYVIVAIVMALYTTENFMPKLTGILQPYFDGENGSWIIKNMFIDKNPVGEWMMKAISQLFAQFGA